MTCDLQTRRPAAWAASAIFCVVGLVACGDAASTTTTASQEPTTQKTSAAPAPSGSGSAKGPGFPLVVVDEQGPVVDGQRSFPFKSAGPEKLAKDVGALPIDGKEVPIVVEKKAKLKDVVALVKALADKGAPTIRIKADARGDLPKELVVVPQSRLVGPAPPCSIVAIITAKFETDVWPVKGAAAKRGPKGLAGPDMSIAGDTIVKELKTCDSKIAFFSADDTLDYEYAHIIGGAILAADAEKKITQLVLLDETPVPGRAVKSLAPK